jgi:hypothetical protein
MGLQLTKATCIIEDYNSAFTGFCDLKPQDARPSDCTWTWAGNPFWDPSFESVYVVPEGGEETKEKLLALPEALTHFTHCLQAAVANQPCEGIPS